MPEKKIPMRLKEKLPKDPLVTIVESKCPVCGKVFCPAPFHRFAINHTYYCSYSCFNKRKERKK